MKKFCKWWRKANLRRKGFLSAIDFKSSLQTRPSSACCRKRTPRQVKSMSLRLSSARQTKSQKMIMKTMGSMMKKKTLLSNWEPREGAAIVRRTFQSQSWKRPPLPLQLSHHFKPWSMAKLQLDSGKPVVKISLKTSSLEAIFLTVASYKLSNRPRNSQIRISWPRHTWLSWHGTSLRRYTVMLKMNGNSSSARLKNGWFQWVMRGQHSWLNCSTCLLLSEHDKMKNASFCSTRKEIYEVW